MNLYKRGKIWWIKYQANGVVYRQSTRTTKKSVAEAWLANIRVAKNMPTFEDAVEVLRRLYQKPAEGKLQIDAAWETYIDLAKAVGKLEIKAKSITDRRNAFRRFARWAEEHAATIKYIEGISGPVAAKYAEYLATLKLKAKTRANHIGNLSTVWTVLEKAGNEIRNPWSSLAPTDTDSQRLEPFTPDEEERVLTAAKAVGKDWHPVCIIARHTGLRYGDVATMRWADVDLAAGVIRRKPGKTKRYGISVTLPIIPAIAQALAGLTRRGDYLFPLHAHLYGKRGQKRQRALSFREVLDAAQVDAERHTFHSWRHTAATRLADAGASVETRKRILGHRRDEMADRYDHAAHLDETRAALERAAGR